MTDISSQRLFKLVTQFNCLNSDGQIHMNSQISHEYHIQKVNIQQFLKSKQNLLCFLQKKQQAVENNEIQTEQFLKKYAIQLKKQLVQAYTKLKNQDQIYQKSTSLSEQIILQSERIIHEKQLFINLLTNQLSQIKYHLDEQKMQKSRQNKQHHQDMKQLKDKIIQYHKTLNQKQEQIQQLYKQLAQYQQQIDQLKSLEYQNMIKQIKQQQKGQLYQKQYKQMQKIIKKLQFQLKQTQIMKNQFYRQIKHLNLQIQKYRTLYQNLIKNSSNYIKDNKISQSNDKDQYVCQRQEKSSYKKLSEVFISELELKHQNSNESCYTKNNLGPYQDEFSFKDSLQNSIQQNQLLNQKSQEFILNNQKNCKQQYYKSKQNSKQKSKQYQNSNNNSNQNNTVVYHSDQNDNLFYVNQYQQNSLQQNSTVGQPHLLQKDIMNLTQRQKSTYSKYSRYNNNIMNSKKRYNKNDDKQNISYNTLQYVDQDYIIQSNQSLYKKSKPNITNRIINSKQQTNYNENNSCNFNQNNTSNFKLQYENSQEKQQNNSNIKASFFGTLKFRQTKNKCKQLFNSNCSISQYCMPSPIPFIKYDTQQKSQKDASLMKNIKYNKIKSSFCGKSIQQFQQYQNIQDGIIAINSQRIRLQKNNVQWRQQPKYQQIKIQNSYENTIQLQNQQSILLNHHDIKQIVINEQLIASKKPKNCNQFQCPHKNIDIYYIFFTLTVQCAKLNSKNFNQVITIFFDLEKQYKTILDEKVPINKWYQHSEQRLSQMLKSTKINKIR